MIPLVVTVAICVGAMIGLLVWSSSRKVSPSNPLAALEEFQVCSLNLASFPQIRQALKLDDINYIKERCGAKAAKQFRKERRRIALCYLESIRKDFQRLSEAATAVAALAPEVDAREEWRRLWLKFEFGFGYQLVCAKFLLATPPAEQLGDLVSIVSSLALKLEETMSEIALGAALGGHSPSSVDE